MDILTLLMIALGLSMDSFSVSVAGGVFLRAILWGRIIKMALFMSLFQAIMPVLGWWGATQFASMIQASDHWIAFTLLLLLGGKMIYEGVCSKQDGRPNNSDPYQTKTLIILAIATSIDALAIGISLALLSISILQACLVIGAVTLIVCIIGGIVGAKIGHKIKFPIEIVGGSILICIGIRILIEHL